MKSFVNKLNKDKVNKIMSILYHKFDREKTKIEFFDDYLEVEVSCYAEDEDGEFGITDCIDIYDYELDPHEFSISREELVRYRELMYSWFGDEYAKRYLFNN